MSAQKINKPKRELITTLGVYTEKKTSREVFLKPQPVDTL